MHTAILLTHPPGTGEFTRLREAVDRELRKGHEVGIFVDVDGVVDGLVAQDEFFRPLSVSLARKRDQKHQTLDDLIERGARVTICRVCARKRSLFPEGTSMQAHLGDYGDLSELLARADQVISL